MPTVKDVAVKQRLIEFLAYQKMGQTKFEQICDLPRGYISNVGTSPGSNILKKIKIQFPELSLDWLILGDGNMIVTENSQSNIVVSTGDNAVSNAGGTQSINESNVGLIAELRKQLEEKDKEIEFLRNLITNLTNK